MISRLRGVVVEVDGDSIVVDVNGVGYSVICTATLLRRLETGNEETLCVYTDVREDAIRLFGFDSHAERQMFLLLNKVSGLGPRSSVDVLSNVPIRDLLRAIGAGDIHALMSIKGVGRKKAERIVVELKDLVVSMADDRSSGLRSMVTVERGSSAQGDGATGDAIAALEVLGFARKDAEVAVSKALEGGCQRGEAGDLIREALRFV
jgi:Holliday junction DNA helicase RuvA